MRALGTYSIVGMPYSSSTLMSFILGSHPMIYGGSDLHHLNPEGRGSCSIHRENCEIRTESNCERGYAAHCDTT